MVASSYHCGISVRRRRTGSLWVAWLAVGWLMGAVDIAESFVAPPRPPEKGFARAHGRRRQKVSASEKSSSENGGKGGIPQLPPIGSSSLPTDAAAASSLNGNSKPFVANHKFQLQYTCNICETRNAHSVSRLAYRQGVVIARCKGCDSQHLIADNLGWTDYDGGFRGNKTNTIEDYFANDETVKVNRVSTEVFELEKILQGYNVQSGAIMGDDGKLAME